MDDGKSCACVRAVLRCQGREPYGHSHKRSRQARLPLGWVGTEGGWLQPGAHPAACCCIALDDGVCSAIDSARGEAEVANFAGQGRAGAAMIVLGLLSTG